MAMKHFEGWDIYDTTTDTDIAAKADDNWGSGLHTNSEIRIKPGRYSGYAVQFVSDVGGTGDAYLNQAVTTGSTDTVYIFFNYKFQSTTEGSNGDYTYIRLHESGAPFAVITEMRINEDKQLEIWYNTNETNSADQTYSMDDDTSWHSVLWQIPKGTNKACKVYIDGLEVLNSTQSITDITFFKIGGIDATSTYSISIDDCFISTNAGNGFTGRPDPTSRIERSAPTSDTADEDWSLSSGTDSYALIDELPHNSDTDYIYSTTVGDDTICGFANASPATGLGVVSVRLSGWWRNENASETHDLIYLVDDGTIAEVGAETAAGTTYTQKTEYFLDQHPRTSTDWSTSTFDGSDWGVRTKTGFGGIG